MTFFEFAFGFAEVLIFGLFFIAMVIGTAFDRSYSNDAVKWWVVVIGALVTIVWFWKDWTFGGVWSTVTSWEFWKPALVYVGIGLGYSVLEFSLAVRRAARKYAERWKTWVAQRNGSASEFVNNDRNYNRNSLIYVTLDRPTDETPVPRVNKEELASSIGAWTIFWPAYFASLILGDLFLEIFRWISNVLVTLSGRFVKMAFQDVFKV